MSIFGQMALSSGASSASATQIVSKAIPTINLVPPSSTIVNVGQSFNFAASVAGAPNVAPPTGALYINAISPQNAPTQKSAALPLRPMTASPGVLSSSPWSMQATNVGLFSVTATYAGDANYNPGTSAPIMVAVIGPQDFEMKPPAAATIPQGSTFQAPINFSSINNFTGNITLSCTGLPALSTCSFGPSSASITLPASAYQVLTPTAASAVSEVSILTTATTVTKVSGGLLLFFLGGNLRRKTKTLKSRKTGILLAFIGSILFMAGCGGMHYWQTDGTPRGTYKVNITATSGAIQHTKTVVLTVQ